MHAALIPWMGRGKTIPPTIPPNRNMQHLLIAVLLEV